MDSHPASSSSAHLFSSSKLIRFGAGAAFAAGAFGFDGWAEELFFDEEEEDDDDVAAAAARLLLPLDGLAAGSSLSHDSKLSSR
jgi:hypothetical protein